MFLHIDCILKVVDGRNQIQFLLRIENVILWKMNTIFYLSAVYKPTLDVNTFHVISGLYLICKNLLNL
mgnify:CR=1 FL=1